MAPNLRWVVLERHWDQEPNGEKRRKRSCRLVSPAFVHSNAQSTEMMPLRMAY